MKLTYAEPRTLERRLQRYGEGKYAKLLGSLVKLAKDKIREHVGGELPRDRPLIFIGTGRSGTITAEVLHEILSDTHQFHRIRTVRIPASLRSVPSDKWAQHREEIVKKLVNPLLVQDLRQAKRNGAYLVLVDATKGAGTTIQRIREAAEILGIPIDKEIILSELPDHRLRTLGRHLDMYAKMMNKLFDKRRIKMKVGDTEIPIDIYDSTR